MIQPRERVAAGILYMLLPRQPENRHDAWLLTVNRLTHLIRLLPWSAACAASAIVSMPVVAAVVPTQGGSLSREFTGNGAKNAVAGRGFEFEGAITALYDTNILRDGGLFSQGRSRGDFLFTPTATVRAGLPFGRQQLFGTVIVGRDFYARNTDFDRLRLNLGGGVNLVVGPNCQGSLFAQYSEQQGRQLDLVNNIPNKQQDTVYQANVGCGRERGLGFGGGFTRLETGNGNPLYRLFDSQTSTLTANARFNGGQIGTLTLSGTYSDVGYPNRQGAIAANGQGDGVKVYSGQVAYRREIGPSIIANIGVSYIDVKPKLSGGGFAAPGYSGPGFDVSLTYHPGVRLSGTLSASRNVTASSNVGASYAIDGSYALDLYYKLSPRLNAAVGGSINSRDYRGAFTSAIDPIARGTDTLHRGYASVSYSPTRLYSVDLTVAQQGRRSTPDLFNFDSTSAAVTLRVKI